MIRIFSGGQSGVDRAALDVALRRQVPCGGWCPRGRRAEDGVIPARYPVSELATDSYDARTEKNVRAADGTVIIYFGRLRGGTEDTLRHCLEQRAPYLLIDGHEVAACRAAERIEQFCRELSAQTLNFAGPRASEAPEAYGYTVGALERFLVLARLQRRAGD